MWYYYKKTENRDPDISDSNAGVYEIKRKKSRKTSLLCAAAGYWKRSEDIHGGNVMIKTAIQLKAKIRNLSGGDNDKAKVLIRNFIMERFHKRNCLPFF